MRVLEPLQGLREPLARSMWPAPRPLCSVHGRGHFATHFIASQDSEITSFQRKNSFGTFPSLYCELMKHAGQAPGACLGFYSLGFGPRQLGLMLSPVVSPLFTAIVLTHLSSPIPKWPRAPKPDLMYTSYGKRCFQPHFPAHVFGCPTPGRSCSVQMANSIHPHMGHRTSPIPRCPWTPSPKLMSIS